MAIINNMITMATLPWLKSIVLSLRWKSPTGTCGVQVN